MAWKCGLGPIPNQTVNSAGCAIGRRFHAIRADDPPSGHEVHMSPEEALRTFVELGAQTFLPRHYATLRLSDEPA